MDRYIHSLGRDALAAQAEACMEALADYLLHYSDLFQDAEEQEEAQLSEWEQALDDYMEHLMDGDTEPALALAGLELSRLEAEHLRDFLGWYLLREFGADASTVQDCCHVLRLFFTFAADRGWIGADAKMAFDAIVQELEPECLRVAKAAQLLFHYVRLGSGVSPRLREQRFSDFIEGHARIQRLDRQHMWLTFDNADGPIGPVCLAAEITNLLKPGDVLDVELGLRGDTWLIVDIGPVYPGTVYMEAEALQVQLTPGQEAGAARPTDA